MLFTVTGSDILALVEYTYTEVLTHFMPKAGNTVLC